MGKVIDCISKLQATVILEQVEEVSHELHQRMDLIYQRQMNQWFFIGFLFVGLVCVNRRLNYLVDLAFRQ